MTAQRLTMAANQFVRKSASEIDLLVDELSPSQKEHHAELRALLKRTVESYERLPGGRVMVASSGPRIHREGDLSQDYRPGLRVPDAVPPDIATAFRTRGDPCGPCGSLPRMGLVRKTGSACLLLGHQLVFEFLQCRAIVTTPERLSPFALESHRRP